MEREYKVVTDEEKQAVIQLGGLHVVGTERHEARRVDNQLRGRSGRWGLLHKKTQAKTCNEASEVGMLT